MSIDMIKETKEFNDNNITINNSPKIDCGRLIYKDDIAYSLFQGANIISTIKELFCGTKEECLNKITELSLNIDLIEEEIG